MQISVVIPVYNAGRFLEDSVRSALIQPEVKEILLVDDGSKDESLEICHRLSSRHRSIIKVLRHQNGINRGAAATRNLGIINAQMEYIAFLDADDIYLENRFEQCGRLFKQNTEADGVYETVVSVAYSPSGGTQIDPRAGQVKAGFDSIVSPDQLFTVLAIAKSGYIHLNGLVLKRASIHDKLLFDPALKPCEDTDFILRLAAVCRLIGGSPDVVVSHRRVHDTNTVFNLKQAIACRNQMMRKAAMHGFYGSLCIKAKWEILNRMARASKMVSIAKKIPLPVFPFRIGVIILFLVIHPKVIIYLLRTSAN